MMNAVYGVATDERYGAVWTNHAAYAAGIDDLSVTIGLIDRQAQLAQGKPGAAGLKKQANVALCLSACEIIGAVRSYTAVNPDPELAAKVAFSPSEVTKGKVSEVVARCRNIYDATLKVAGALTGYGITAAKLSIFKKKIDAFDAVKVAPRQSRVSQSAATRLIPGLVRSGAAVLREQLDGLMIQFKSANPNFYKEYFAARTVVNNRGRSVAASPGNVTTATPAVAKAA